MAKHTSKVGQRADRVTATDDPHDRYTADGRPVLQTTELGQIIEKSVTAYTVICRRCWVPAQFNELNEAECPECGMLCGGKGSVPHPPIVRDSKAAGRADITL